MRQLFYVLPGAGVCSLIAGSNLKAENIMFIHAPENNALGTVISAKVSEII